MKKESETEKKRTKIVNCDFVNLLVVAFACYAVSEACGVKVKFEKKKTKH